MPTALLCRMEAVEMEMCTQDALTLKRCSTDFAHAVLAGDRQLAIRLLHSGAHPSLPVLENGQNVAETVAQRGTLDSLRLVLSLAMSWREGEGFGETDSSDATPPNSPIHGAPFTGVALPSPIESPAPYKPQGAAVDLLGSRMKALGVLKQQGCLLPSDLSQALLIEEGHAQSKWRRLASMEFHLLRPNARGDGLIHIMCRRGTASCWCMSVSCVAALMVSSCWYIRFLLPQAGAKGFVYSCSPCNGPLPQAYSVQSFRGVT